MNNNSSEGKEFLGAGIAFPFGVDAEGHISMKSLEEHVHQSILLILQTAKRERVMRPEFGAGLNDLVFSPLNATTLALVEHEVREALIRFEPRIDVLNVKAAFDAEDTGMLFINVGYRVRRTDTMFNLVYPFYLERGTI